MDKLDDVIKEMQWWMRIKADLPSVCGRAIEAMNEQKELLIKKQNEIDRLKAEQPKHGHWIEQEGFDGDVYYDCSVCGESWVLIDGTPKDNGMIYCPHCGARMDGEQE